MSGANELAPEGQQEVQGPEGTSAASVDAVPVLEEEVVPAKPPVGERLRVAREARAMDIDAVASALKLSKRQIEALEAGDWDKLPGHTFIRGFVRNYARVVQLDVESLLADLDAPPPKAPRLDLPNGTATVMPQRGQAQKRDYAAVLAGLVLVAIAVVAYFVVPQDLWLSKTSAPVPTSKEATESVPLFPPGATPASVAAGDPAGAAGVSPVQLPVVDGSGLPADGRPTVQPVVAAPGKGLRFTFAQPSWVEVRDRSGQIIFSQLNPAGSDKEIDGQPPFSLVVGNAGHVTVQYQGRTIDLQPRSKDDVARVTVE